jgi:hypothetical protein
VIRIVLDAGALIALDRNHNRMWARVRLARSRRARIFVPSTVVAQVWRGSASQALLARALGLCSVAPFDPVAREIGVLCGRTQTSDICDAHVALVAAECDVLYTDDEEDMRTLIAACRRSPMIVAI